jgi:hypothetical protein
MFDTKPKRSASSEVVDHHVSFVGAGAAPVVKVADTGPGMTCTRNGVGLVTLAWTDDPGIFLGLQPNFQATVPAGVKGYTCVPGVYSAATKSIQLSITSAAEALVDLAALQWLNLTISFKRIGTGVS